MDYSTYWSVIDTPSKNIQSSSICLYIAIAATILWFLAKKFKRDQGNDDRIALLWATGVFAILGLAGYILLTVIYPDKSKEKTLELLDSAATLKVEGNVSNFQRTFRNAKYGRETVEKFTVDTVQFAYGDAALGKFNSFAQTNNNVIFNGQRVRVTYRSGSPYGDTLNSILKLEIGR